MQKAITIKKKPHNFLRSIENNYFNVWEAQSTKL